MTIRLFALGAALTLGACGGGGGGGGPPPALQLSHSQLSFARSVNGAAPAPVTITGTVTNARGTIYVGVAHTSNGIGSLTAPTFSGTQAFVDVTMKWPSVAGHGEFVDTITVAACTDPNCVQHVAGSPAIVNVSYRVGIAADPASVSAQAIEGAAGPVRGLDVSYYDGSAAWTSSVSYAQGSGWLSATPASGATLPESIELGFGSLLPGTYGASLTLNAGTDARSLPVEYTVLSLLAFQAPAAFSVTTTPAASQTRDVAITSRDPARQVNWTAAPASPAPWLALTQASGNTGTPTDALRLALDADAVLTTPNGTHRVDVVVTPQGASPVIVPVSITLNRPFVSAAAPYVIGPGAGGTVIVRGERLGDSAITGVMLGDTAATGFTYVNATKLTVQYPALAEGRHAVRIQAGGVTLAGTAELVVRTPPKLEPLGFSAPIAPTNSVVFDPERDACYFPSSTGITAVRAVDGAWQVQSVVEDIAGLINAALASNGRELIAFTHSGVVHVDPATLAVTARVPMPTLGHGDWLGFMVGSDDGSVLFGRAPGLWRYDTGARTFAAVPGITASAQPTLLPSGARNRMVWWYSNGCCSFPYRLLETSPFASTLMSNFAQFPRARGDRFGDRWVFTTTVTDATDATQATVPDAASWAGSLLDASGNTLYVSDVHTKTCPSCANYDPHINVYDLSAVAFGGSPTLARTLNVYEKQLGGQLNADETELVSCSHQGVSGFGVDGSTR